MNKEPTNGELAIMLKNISEGIKEVHAKQDYTNGQVRINTEYRLRQDGALSFFKWVGAGNLVAIIILYIRTML